MLGSYRTSSLALCIALPLAGAAVAGAVSPVAVSPATRDGSEALAPTCPTFQWATDSASQLELVVYRLSDAGSEPAREQLRVSLPGSARGWSPSLDRCLDPGQQYAWVVGASSESEITWSEPSVFRVAEAPSIAEVEDALDVLRRYVASTPPNAELSVSEAALIRPNSTLGPLVGSTVGVRSERSRTVEPPSSYSLSIDGPFKLGGPIFSGGYSLLHVDGGIGAGNTALGLAALNDATPGDPNYFNGSYNTAVGQEALGAFTTGLLSTAVGFEALKVSEEGTNTAVGAQALLRCTTCDDNTAIGNLALSGNTTGSANTAVGAEALRGHTGFRNVALGFDALSGTGAGERNVALGAGALVDTLGSRNIAVGDNAGVLVGSDNIHIGNLGETSEDTTIRIGTGGTQTRAFLAGVTGVSVSGDPVVVASDGQLGSASTLTLDQLIAADGSPGSPSIRFSGDNNTGLFLIGNNSMGFTTAGNERMRVGQGSIQIGNVTPTQLQIIEEGTPLLINRLSSDGTLISLQQDGSEEGTITVSGSTVSYNNFTGSHAAWSNVPIDRAHLVTLTGDNRRLHDDRDSEIVYGVEPSQRANDPAVLGSYLALTRPSEPFDASNPHLVTASGNSEVWVVDTGRDIRPGDYLISSSVQGHAMVDDRAGAVSHIFGRAGEGVVWDEIEPTAPGVRRVRISVLLGAFVRDNAALR